ncbi:Cytochrome bd-I ubiquinol oxidase subunit 2 [Fundidesulfovibrio magnetotacticus]|uniref:Cytochrome bd-I ubiquinol oxidase subunit 2 n=1 Tax=Fundidesulfovibrio magnetotacticus TaxID=2730080 RepID=A0A6V8LU17_9BACT|nr:cytochrome d ubiquinol oxidase subunit II [Fundidesulfovibrio magnetotacticus]GFK93599.1 Cytochrome bd-I ubiquinol oxidase subunit 2 [Fundidesulfovibrio magnetotacticus]
MDHALYAELWLWLLALALAATVILDGFDLGVGILCLREPDEDARASMMASIEGVWHANQTWLVVAGGVLFGAFPKAYGMLLSSLYLPAGLLLLGLMARGIGLEYHAEGANKRFWSNLFGYGSLLVALAEGAMLGAVMQGLPMEGHVRFLKPFAWLGLGAVAGAGAMACVVSLLGAAWLSRASLAHLAKPDDVLRLALGAVALQLTMAFVVPVSGLAGMAVWAAGLWCLLRAVRASGIGPFWGWTWTGVLLFLVGWLWAMRPEFAPPGLTPLSASAAAGSLRIMLIGFAVVTPVIVVYTIYQYRVFRGQGAYQDHELHH